jgi:peptidoglycan/LPS O-acetylase OafA/YrhL
METLRLILLIVHILGFSALIGGLFAQAGSGEKKVNAAMRDGVGTAFIAGLALVGVLESGDDPVNHGKVAVKLLIGLVLLVLVMANARKTSIPQGLWAGLLALAVVNVAVAVLWSSVHTF